MEIEPSVDTVKRNGTRKFKKFLFIVIGTISLGLGCIGIILPILPTTPFLLLSVACYYKSSERMHSWLLNNKLFGSYIRNYKEGNGIPLKTKILTLVFLWAAISYSAFFILNILNKYIKKTTIFIKDVLRTGQHSY